MRRFVRDFITCSSYESELIVMSILGKLKKITGLSQKAAQPAAEPVVATKPVFEIPTQLPRLAAADAEGIAAFFPEGIPQNTTEIASVATVPGDSPRPTKAGVIEMPTTAPEQLDLLLNQEGKPIESIHYLSQGMEQKTAMDWAAQSVDVVEASLPQVEKDALAAGKAAMVDPSPENIALAESTAKASEPMGPGAWMAMAAATPATQGANNAGLFAQSIAGAVMLSAALTLPDTELPEKPEMPEAPEMPEIPEMDMMEMPAFEPPEIPLVEAPVLSQQEQNEAMVAYKPFIDNALKLAAQPI